MLKTGPVEQPPTPFNLTNLDYICNFQLSCRELYTFVVYLYVNGSGSITSVGDERANLSAVVYL